MVNAVPMRVAMVVTAPLAAAVAIHGPVPRYDDELGGSGFVQVFAHAPEVFKHFIDFYFKLELETRGAVDGVITELARLMVAQKNNCHL